MVPFRKYIFNRLFMKKQLFILCTLLLCSTTWAKDCANFNYEKDNCAFELPEISSGELRALTFEGNNYKGNLISKCTDGKHVILKETCEYEPKGMPEGACAGVPSTTWDGLNGEVCSHDNIDQVIQDTKRLEIQSGQSTGKITYACDNGLLTKVSVKCGEVSQKGATKQAKGSFGTRDVGACTPSGTFNLSNLDRVWDGINNTYDLPANTSLEAICTAECKGGQGHDGFIGGTASATAGASFEYYNLACDCCENNVAAPSACTPTSLPYNPLNLDVHNDTGSVTICDVAGEIFTDPVTGQQIESLDPSSETLKTLGCEAYGFTNLITVDALSALLPAIDRFTATMTCSGYDPTINIDGSCRGNFLGARVNDAGGVINYEVPVICEENECWEMIKPEDAGAQCIAPADNVGALMCHDCPAVTSWAEPDIAGGTCVAPLDKVITGETKRESFFNGNFNGIVKWSCNNGVETIDQSECYHTCNTDANGAWGDGLLSYYYNQDKAGACRASIPGDSRNAEVTDMLPTTRNTGDAAFACEGFDGTWNIEAQECLLDCPRYVYWPEIGESHQNTHQIQQSGANNPHAMGWSESFDSAIISSTTGSTDKMATDGNSEYICSYDMGARKPHSPDDVINVSANGTFNRGTVSARCNDGYWEVTGWTCNSHCAAETLYWGTGNARDGSSKVQICSTEFPKTDHLSGLTLVTDQHTGTAGQSNAAASCNDGNWELNANSCFKDCSPTISGVNPSSDPLTWNGGGRTCMVASKNVGDFRHNASHTFQDETTFNNGSVTYTCNDGKWDITAASCGQKTCAPTTGTWSQHGSCADGLGTGSVTDGSTATSTITDFAVESGGGTGEATFRCVEPSNPFTTNGTWVLDSVATCWNTCSGTGKSWSNCSQSIGLGGAEPISGSGDSTTIYDTNYGGTSGGYEGQRSFTCNATTGNWDGGGWSCDYARDCSGYTQNYTNCDPMSNCTAGNTSASCVEYRIYDITNGDKAGIGSNCPYTDGAIVSTRNDTTTSCPVNCAGGWSNTGTCSASCGGGVLRQEYNISTSQSGSGSSCPYGDGATRWGSTSCNTSACPVACAGYYTNTSTCSASCGGGTLVQSFVQTQAEVNGGGACPPSLRSGSTSCNTQSCATCSSYSSAYGATSEGACMGQLSTQTSICTSQGCSVAVEDFCMEETGIYIWSMTCS
jgi:hypothetical protein